MGVGGALYAFPVLVSSPEHFLAGMLWLAVAAAGTITAGIFLRRAGPSQRGNQKVFDEAALGRQYTFILLGFLCLFLAAASILAITLPVASLVALGVLIVWVAIWLPEATRTRTSGFEFAVSCSPEKAFDFVADRRHAPLYVNELEVSELLSELPIGVGSRFFQRVRLPEILMETEEVITEFDRPGKLAYELTTRRKSGGTFKFSAQPSGTLIRYDSYRVDALYGGWAGLLLHPGRQRAAEAIAHHRQAWSKRLKEILES
jgi:polyketide cyclase/dehydrase/lipid transport protein